jgi:hypothetical protein
MSNRPSLDPTIPPEEEVLSANGEGDELMEEAEEGYSMCRLLSLLSAASISAQTRPLVFVHTSSRLSWYHLRVYFDKCSVTSLFDTNVNTNLDRMVLLSSRT